MRGIYIFRRDLRLKDNHGLNLVSVATKADLLPVFLLDPSQVYQNTRNQHYFSPHALQFMCESLIDLNQQLIDSFGVRLVVLEGEPSTSLEKLIRHLRPEVVGWNADWSTIAKHRDVSLKEVCKKHGVKPVVCTSDGSLHSLKYLCRDQYTPYMQFGAFYKHALGLGPPKKPCTVKTIRFWGQSAPFEGEVAVKELPSRLYKANPRLAQRGGRSEALQRLRMAKLHKNYNTWRDRLDKETTMLSGHLNFGCVSTREAFYAFRKKLGSDTDLLKQLYWRDFFLHIAALHPDACSFSRHMNPEFDSIKWETNEKTIKSSYDKLWASKTGFLLVDAGMAQMRATGFMHNRTRMIVGVFWTKYLRIHILHPRYGSQVGFSSQLLDAIGPSQNKLNHHWITELDLSGRRYAPKGVARSGRPMDISNRMIKKWDPTGAYIKKWLPHLSSFSVKELVHWGETPGDAHPSPMFDSKKQYQAWVKACQ